MGGIVLKLTPMPVRHLSGLPGLLGTIIVGLIATMNNVLIVVFATTLPPPISPSPLLH